MLQVSSSPPKGQRHPMRVNRVQQPWSRRRVTLVCRAWHETCKFSRFGPSGVKRLSVAHCLGPDLWDATTLGPGPHWSVWLRSDIAYRIARASKHSRNTETPTAEAIPRGRGSNSVGAAVGHTHCSQMRDVRCGMTAARPPVFYTGVAVKRMQPLVCRMQVPHPLDASLAA